MADIVLIDFMVENVNDVEAVYRLQSKISIKRLHDVSVVLFVTLACVGMGDLILASLRALN